MKCNKKIQYERKRKSFILMYVAKQSKKGMEFFMKENENKIIAIVIIVIVIAVVGISGALLYQNFKVNKTSKTKATIAEIEIDIDDGDEKIDWSEYKTYNYELTESITITKGGIYNLTGTIADGYIKIDTDDNVKLILNNVKITNSSGPAIYVENAKNTVIVLQENTTNYLEDGTTYDGFDEDVNSVIYSKDDIIFNGDGTLVITANYQNGIVGKDDLKIINGNYEITATDTGIKGKDSVYILNGKFNIKAGGKGIKSTNDEDTSKGFVLIKDGDFTIDSTDDSLHSNNYIEIDGGTFNLSSGDDGIHADTQLVINDGTININKSYEGIESTQIVINGGNLNIVSKDDGINAATSGEGSDIPGHNTNSNANSNNLLVINGGNIFVNAEGDGIDTNGSGYMYGGTVIVNGPTNAGNGFLDYDGEFIIDGGTFIGASCKGMVQGASSDSTQNNLLVTFESSYDSGTVVKIVDEENSVIIENTFEKSFSAMLISSSALEKSKTYTVLINDETYSSFTVDSTTTTIGNSNGGNTRGGMQQGERGKGKS